MRVISVVPIADLQKLTPQSQTQLLTVDEWMTILEAFHRIGVKAVRLTGGEPLLYPHIEELLGRINDTGWFEDISMTTNGSLLASRSATVEKTRVKSCEY